MVAKSSGDWVSHQWNLTCGGWRVAAAGFTLTETGCSIVTLQEDRDANGSGAVSIRSGENLMTKKQAFRYFVFDTESVADGQLVADIRYPAENLAPEEAIQRYRRELLEKTGSEFIPYTFQVPVSVSVGKVSADLELQEIVTLDEPHYRPHVITENFWRGWSGYGHPTLVSFNGRSFDIPLLELAAFRYGISVPEWFDTQLKSWDQYRNRYNQNAHLDLQELLCNFGASRIHGGLNLIANLLGKPGKMGIAGHMVQDLYQAGKIAEINDYCRCDVLDTYFVFLRSAVLQGQITLQREQELVEKTRVWLEQQFTERPAYSCYVDAWGEWTNPWKENPAAVAEVPAQGVERENA